jgi:hypothetical protein
MKTICHELICIIDRSGSMESIKDDAIGGYNAFIDEQKKQPEPTRVTLELFDDQFERVYEAMPIDEISPLDSTTFVPRGSTALLDAIGRALANAFIRINNMAKADRPEGVVIAILTDGQENSSVEFGYRNIAQLIAKRRSEEKWEFVFLGANQDAIATASKMAMDQADAVSFSATPTGTHVAFEAMSEMVSERRTKLRRY